MPTQTATRTGGRTQQSQPRPPLRTTPKGHTYAQGRPHGMYPKNTPISASSRSSSSGRSGGRTQQGTGGGRRASTAAPKKPASTTAPSSSGSGNSPGRSSRSSGFTMPELREYQGIILAEFILAELLVAATPIATKSTDTGSGYLSPYVGADMVKMLSLGLLYFLLELLSIGGGRMARTAAWFGGLILIVVGLNEAANIAKTLDLFAGINPKSSSKSTS